MEYNLAEMIKNDKDVEVYGGSNTPKLQRGLIQVNKEYMHALTSGYIKAIDLMIEYLNGAEIPKTVYHKINMVMSSLVLADEEVEYLKNTKNYSESGVAIPNMTEVIYLNDIPVSFDIVESVYLYILKIARENGFMAQNGIFGDLNISGVMFDNLSDLTGNYQSYVIGIDGEVSEAPTTKLTQKITDLCRANNVLRDRMLKLLNGGKTPSRSDAIELKRKYKFDPETGSFQKRLKPVSKIVYALIANKIETSYSELKKNAKIIKRTYY